MNQTIKDPITLYAIHGLEGAVRILESANFTNDEIVDITSKYLDKNDFTVKGPMVVGIGSSKGGPGKSTVATNLVHGFGRLGMKAGLIDADISDPNDALRVYNDTEELTSDDEVNVDFGDNLSVLDVIIGRKIKGKRTLQRKNLSEIGIQSKRRDNVTYFLCDQLGDNQEGRGDKRQREKSLREAEGTLLREARKLEDLQVVIMDFPAGTPEYLDAYIGCDERGYVVDFNDHASFAGIENIAKLAAKKRIDGNNFMLVNKIPQIKHREEFLERINWIGKGLDKVATRIGLDNDENFDKARMLVEGYNRKLDGLKLEKLAFNPQPALLAYRQAVLDASNSGLPYLASLDSRSERTSKGYTNEIFKLAANMVGSHMNKAGGK